MMNIDTPLPDDKKPLDADAAAALGKTLTVYGDRVAVIEAEASNMDDGILLPDDRHRQWTIVRVVAVGSAVKNEQLVNGTIALVQMHAMMAQQCRTKFSGGIGGFVIPSGDILAILSAPAMRFDCFAISGRWVLCSVEQPEKVGEIFLPSGAAVTQDTIPRYCIEQLGYQAADFLGLAKGTEVYLNRARATPIQFGVGRDKKLCVYLDFVDVTASIEAPAPMFMPVADVIAAPQG